MGFAGFMASTAGRLIRIVAGIVLVVVGLVVIGFTTTGIVVAVVGLVPLLAGLLDICFFAPLFGGAFKGSEARKAG
ncbi:MAG: DUF2892 domain-containing protein [Anaerolineae bacterium]|nr:DUF2892 domain-containing protein [Anaerolineae bacterium]